MRTLCGEFERTTLKLAAGDQVVRFDRVRPHAERSFAYEIVCLLEWRIPVKRRCSP